MRDIRSDYINIINGRRLVPISVGDYKNRIHLFGDSRILSVYTSDEHTIACYLQKKILEEKGEKYRVLNYGIPRFGIDHIERIYYQIAHACFKEGDIIVVGGKIRQSVIDKPEDMEELLSFVEKVCIKYKLKAILLHCPYIYEMSNRTYIEQFIMDSFDYLHTKVSYAQGKVWNSFLDICRNKDIKLVDMSQYADTRRSYGEIFVDLLHYGPNGNQWISDKLYDEILTEEQPDWNNGGLKNRKTLEERSIQVVNKVVAQFRNSGMSKENLEELNSYLDNCKEQMKNFKFGDDIGAIVMNGNPFTLGHRYLIETAAAKVKQLIVFVVEEDKSFFHLKERLYLIKEGCKDLMNVFVIPSGKFIISTITFPEYFEKDKIASNASIDSSMDLTLFGEYIAPYFGIKTRFVGEEPLDPVTRQYNEMMKEVLDDYEIKTVEISRKELAGAVISASRVRKLLLEKDYDEIKYLVPKVTYEYLLNYKSR